MHCHRLESLMGSPLGELVDCFLLVVLVAASADQVCAVRPVMYDCRFKRRQTWLMKTCWVTGRMRTSPDSGTHSSGKLAWWTAYMYREGWEVWTLRPLEYGNFFWASNPLHARLCPFSWRRGMLPFRLSEGKCSSREGASGVLSSLMVGGALPLGSCILWSSLCSMYS